MRPAILLAALGTLTGAARPSAADPPRYAVTAADAGRVRAVLTYDVSYPKLKAKEWIWFAAAAPELPGQVQVKTTTDPAGAAAQTKDSYAHPLLLVRVPARTAAQRTALPMKVTYEATLRSRALEVVPAGKAPPAVADLPAADRKLYLAEHSDFQYKPDAFQAWMKKTGFVRKDGEGEVGFARRVFLGIRSAFTYEYTPDADRSAPAVCKAGKSDCGGLSSLFITVMRANRIPARTLCGRWAQSADPAEKLAGGVYYQWHVKAEFFAAGVGWVPVDMASGILHDKTAEGLTYFGQDPGDFLAFHTDADLTVDTKLFGVEKVANFQSPVYWVNGDGELESMKATEGWVVEKLK
jgi:transglutaminase-like putative cysteine protease